MIPAPDGFRDLRAYLHERRVDAAWIRTVLDQYLSEYENQQTDVDMDLDHQVFTYRAIINDFKHLIEDDVEDDDTAKDPADAIGDQAA
ncbi:hypothetical protein [Persicitalea jodogahamensis]|uniref:Uncharacterized protein n=1 Tax=Persicitalea jodogahamensis TaxID=402147 RepID=A0A8J3D7E7_9BACT|nr:hypothetical protein [Persicitalea jodogahamensis]GHB64043.1 hypothetical protein GCM10007390_17400 [Persicitalea jodogahamensis]